MNWIDIKDLIESGAITINKDAPEFDVIRYACDVEGYNLLEKYIFYKEWKENCGQWSDYGRYSDYLASDSWQYVRHLTLDRDNHVCQICGKNHSLCVHHISYENGTNPHPWDLVTLCSDCHQKLHSVINATTEEAGRIWREKNKEETRMKNDSEKELGEIFAGLINQTFKGFKGVRKSKAVSIIRDTFHNTYYDRHRIMPNYTIVMQKVKKL